MDSTLISIAEQFEQAAGLAPKILEQDVAAWEKWIDIFVQHQQLPVGTSVVIRTIIIVTDDILGDHSIYPDTKAQARKTCVRDGVYASFDQRQTGKPQLIWKNRTNTYNRLF